jgi:Golgi SNAP receptor complex protein 1
VQSALDKANLLRNVRNDIEYVLFVLGMVPRADMNSAYKTVHSSDADALLAERGRIDSSHRMTDDILLYVHVFHAIGFLSSDKLCHQQTSA